MTSRSTLKQIKDYKKLEGQDSWNKNCNEYDFVDLLLRVGSSNNFENDDSDDNASEKKKRKNK